MNQTQAIAKLKAAIGPGFAYRLNPAAKKAPQREAASEKARALSPKIEAAKTALAKREAELLAADAKYQEIKADLQAMRRDHSEARSTATACPITVGTSNSLFFSIKAQGDNWQELVDEVCSKKAAKGA